MKRGTATVSGNLVLPPGAVLDPALQSGIGFVTLIFLFLLREGLPQIVDLLREEQDLVIDYVAVCDPETLERIPEVEKEAVLLVAVILSLIGVMLGLLVTGSAFGVIMTGVGVISLAGVVVNNAIVLIDYTNRLHKRGMHFREAIVAAGCTRLRPVILTAVTTILGLMPMVTGIAFNFHNMELSTASESSQWWGPMASAVIFGLAMATVLTLVVVPTLYSLVYTSSRAAGRGVKAVRRAYWAPFHRLTGTTPEEEGQV